MPRSTTGCRSPEAAAILKQYGYAMNRTLVNEDEPVHMARRRVLMEPFTPEHLRKHERGAGLNFDEVFGKDHADSFLLLESGRADAFVMPSRYEPCGLNQMYSLRYGTPPIVRKTGGLADTVQTYDPARETGNGWA